MSGRYYTEGAVVEKYHAHKMSAQGRCMATIMSSGAGGGFTRGCGQAWNHETHRAYKCSCGKGFLSWESRQIHREKKGCDNG